MLSTSLNEKLSSGHNSLINTTKSKSCFRLKNAITKPISFYINLEVNIELGEVLSDFKKISL